MPVYPEGAKVVASQQPSPRYPESLSPSQVTVHADLVKARELLGNSPDQSRIFGIKSKPPRHPLSTAAEANLFEHLDDLPNLFDSSYQNSRLATPRYADSMQGESRLNTPRYPEIAQHTPRIMEDADYITDSNQQTPRVPQYPEGSITASLQPSPRYPDSSPENRRTSPLSRQSSPVRTQNSPTGKSSPAPRYVEASPMVYVTVEADFVQGGQQLSPDDAKLLQTSKIFGEVQAQDARPSSLPWLTRDPAQSVSHTPRQQGSGLMLTPRQPVSGLLITPRQPGSGLLLTSRQPGSGLLLTPRQPGSGLQTPRQPAPLTFQPPAKPSSSEGLPSKIMPASSSSEGQASTPRPSSADGRETPRLDTTNVAVAGAPAAASGSTTPRLQLHSSMQAFQPTQISQNTPRVQLRPPQYPSPKPPSYPL